MKPKSSSSDFISDFQLETRKSMGERIRQLWVESGEQQDEFVKALGISTVTLANYMSGKRKPDSEFLFFLKKKLNICIDWLLTGEGRKFPSDSQLGSKTTEEQSSPPNKVEYCPRCERLEAKLEKVENQRDELIDEIRKLFKENAMLREENAIFRERQRKEQASLFDENRSITSVVQQYGPPPSHITKP